MDERSLQEDTAGYSQLWRWERLALIANLCSNTEMSRGSREAGGAGQSKSDGVQIVVLK